MISGLIPTTKGFSFVEDLVVGDKIFNKDGKLTNIVAIEDGGDSNQLYRVTFNNDDIIVCGLKHCFMTMTDKERTQSQRLTPEFRENRKKHRPSRALKNPKRKYM